MNFPIDPGSDAHMVPFGMFSAPIVPKEGRTAKFELANGKTIDSIGDTDLGTCHKVWLCFPDAMPCCPGGEANNLIRVATQPWSQHCSGE